MSAKRARPVLGRRAPAPIVVHSAPLVLPIADDPIRDGAVAVRGERVLQVGAREDLLTYFPVTEERRWPGMIVAGLVDACSASGPPAAGVTARGVVVPDVGEHHSPAGTAGTGSLVTASAGVTYVEVACESEDAWERHGRDAVITAIREMDRPHAVGIAARTPDPLVLEDIAVLARTFGLRLLVNLGARSPAVLDEAGVLGPHCHATCDRPLDPGERKLLRLRGTAVAISPSPDRPDAAVNDVLALLDEGNAVALSTYGAARGGLLGLARDIREQARALGLRVRGLDRRLVEAATLGGARALGMGGGPGGVGGTGRIGSLGPGSRADFAVFDARGRYPYSALLARPDCLATVTGGRVHAR